MRRGTPAYPGVWTRDSRTDTHESVHRLMAAWTRKGLYTYSHTLIHTNIHTHIHTVTYIHRLTPTLIHTYIHTLIPTYIHTYTGAQLKESRMSRNTYAYTRVAGHAATLLCAESSQHLPRLDPACTPSGVEIHGGRKESAVLSLHRP